MNKKVLKSLIVIVTSILETGKGSYPSDAVVERAGLLAEELDKQGYLDKVLEELDGRN